MKKLMEEFEREYMKRPVEPCCENEYPEQWANVLDWQWQYSEWLEKKLSDIPEFETPEQYRERTGEDWPDDGLVYYLSEHPETNKRIWGYCFLATAMAMEDKYIICATGSGRPPKDYRPEGK